MKQILNKENEKYARKCFEEAIDMGVNFKLENKVREKIFSKESMEELLKLPISESTPEDVLNDFNKIFYHTAQTFLIQNLWDFQMQEIAFLV